MAEIKVDSSGRKVVIIPKIVFKNKKNINWNNVQIYLQRYIGKTVKITETNDIIFLGNKFLDEIPIPNTQEH